MTEARTLGGKVRLDLSELNLTRFQGTPAESLKAKIL
jgi:hypothetical protein